LYITGAAADAVDVLKLAPPGEWSDNGVVTFDGKSVAVDVKQGDVFGSGGLASQFTVSAWMKREHQDDDRLKQHLMCSSDAEGQITSVIRILCLEISACEPFCDFKAGHCCSSPQVTV